jgi:endogenous inhibitor of DNA gyrase (YacG/DUF329 family)
VADRTCPICWTGFTVPGQRKKTFCSDRCRKTSHQRRHSGQPAGSPDPLAEPAPVAQRDCPYCGHPIVVVALLTTPQAARADPPTPVGNILVLHHSVR